MGPGELAFRLKRPLDKRLRARLRAAPPTLEEARREIGPRMGAAPGRHLLERDAPASFFPLARRRVLAARFVERDPVRAQAVVHEAGAALDHGVELLGAVFRPHEPDFDWRADPFHGPVFPFTVLEDGDVVGAGGAADVKHVWEINRHQHLVVLARAGLYSGEERFARAVVAQVRRWIEQNPPGVGVNWSSNLEVAIRSLSWVWCLHFLAGDEALDEDAATLWLGSLRHHRDHLARHLSVYTDRTNHLLGEAVALALLAIWLPEWPGAARLRARALAVLAREVPLQIAPDGVDRERATSYQRFVLDLLLQLVALAGRNGVDLPAELPTVCRTMVDATEVLLGPDDRAPRLGDSDDARGIPFAHDDLWDFSDLISLADAVLAPAPSGPPCEAAFWISGGVDPGPKRQRRSGSALLADGGYARLVRGSDRLLFDCGPLGLPPHASHGHAGLGAVLVDLGGEELLVDPGTYSYGLSAERDRFRSTPMHNTVTVGNRDQVDPAGPFMWMFLPRTKIERAELGGEIEYVEAWHDGYRRLARPVRHRRGVLGHPAGWLILDWLHGSGEAVLERTFVGRPGSRPTPLPEGGIVWATGSGAREAVLRDLGGGDARATVGEVPCSERYGRSEPAPVVRIREARTLPVLLLTALDAEGRKGPGSSAELRAGEVLVHVFRGKSSCRITVPRPLEASYDLSGRVEWEPDWV